MIFIRVQCPFPLRRIIIPSSGIVKVISCADHWNFAVGTGLGSGGMSCKIVIHLFNSGVEMPEHLLIAGAVPQFVEQEDLHGQRCSVQDESIFLISFFGQIGIQIFHGAPVIQIQQGESDEAGIPGIKTIPESSRGVIPYKFSAAPDGINNICHDHGSHPFHAEQIRASWKRQD